jgi:hypothetical protein
MADTDSDADYEYDSPLSSSVLYGAKQYSPSRPRSLDRLYSMGSAHRHVPSESEHSSLLNNHDGTRTYLATPVAQSPDHMEQTFSTPRPLKILTRKISRVFQSKAYDYDNNKHSLAAVGSGERVW